MFVVLDKMGSRVIGGKKETVVMDDAIAGVHPDDVWPLGSLGISNCSTE